MLNASVIGAALAAGLLDQGPGVRIEDYRSDFHEFNAFDRRQSRPVAPHHRRYIRHLDRAERKPFNDRVRAQAGFTTRECEQLTALANKQGVSFEEVAAEARRLREFG